MKFLLIDDHPMAIEFYHLFIQEYFSRDTTLTISKAFNCEQAYHFIEDQAESGKFDWAFVDYRLPAFGVQNMYSGADIAILLRKNCPNCKIIMLTGHTEALLVYDILWKVHPEGFAAKCDINYETLQTLTKSVESGAYYKSKTIKESAKKILNEKILVDSNNRKIVALIMQGYKIKDLHKLIDLKPSTIHRRVLNIKRSLKISGDTNIVRQLIESGYITSIYLG